MASKARKRKTTPTGSRRTRGTSPPPKPARKKATKRRKRPDPPKRPRAAKADSSGTVTASSSPPVEQLSPEELKHELASGASSTSAGAPRDPNRQADDARKAAAGEGGEDKGKTAPVDPEEQGRRLVAAAEMVMVQAVRGYAITKRVWSPELLAGLRYTPEERSLLMETAPMAAPYVEMLLKHFDKLAAGIFFLCCFSMTNQRLKAIDRLAKAAAEAEPTETDQPADDPPGNGSGSALQAREHVPEGWQDPSRTAG